MRILILGDSHGRLDLVRRACLAGRRLLGIDAAIQVGDFGFFPKVFAAAGIESEEPFPIPLHVIDGNHEDHAWLRRCREEGMVSRWQSANLLVHPRGSVIDCDGCTVGFLGGALHADRHQEWAGQPLSTEGDDRPSARGPIPQDPAWANWVTPGDVARALPVFRAYPPDLMVTHACPAGIGIGMRGSLAMIDEVDRYITRAGHDSGDIHDCGERELTRLWDQLDTHPPHWVFGHFHQLWQRTIRNTTFTCVGSTDGSDGVTGVRPVVYDTRTRVLSVDPEGRLWSEEADQS